MSFNIAMATYSFYVHVLLKDAHCMHAHAKFPESRSAHAHIKPSPSASCFLSVDRAGVSRCLTTFKRLIMLLKEPEVCFNTFNKHFTLMLIYDLA